ncbi:MAG: hypothetical protein GX096_09665 [Clostridiales bacterium]|nr:hypothetical protein [Clostridiales bacterium]
MFENIGGKIKKLAIIGLVSSVIVSVIAAVIIFKTAAQNSTFTGIMVIVAGFLVGYIEALVIYAFGTLVENSQILVNASREQAAAQYAQPQERRFPRAEAPRTETSRTESPKTEAPRGEVPRKDCPHCGTSNNGKNTICFGCKKSI